LPHPEPRITAVKTRPALTRCFARAGTKKNAVILPCRGGAKSLQETIFSSLSAAIEQHPVRKQREGSGDWVLPQGQTQLVIDAFAHGFFRFF